MGKGPMWDIISGPFISSLVCSKHGITLGLVQTSNFTCADFSANDENLLVPAHFYFYSLEIN